jgi:hypothetical protein
MPFMCFMQIMSVIIYLFHFTARLCTAITSSLEFRFRYSCQTGIVFEYADVRVGEAVMNKTWGYQ